MIAISLFDDSLQTKMTALRLSLNLAVPCVGFYVVDTKYHVFAELLCDLIQSKSQEAASFVLSACVCGVCTILPMN